MEFEEYDQKNKESEKPTEIRIHPGANQAYVTAGAVEEYFHRYGSVVDEVGYLTNEEQSVLAFDRDAEAGNVFSFVDSDSGGNLAIRGVFRKTFGFDPENIDETHALPLEVDDESGYVMVDLKPVVEDATDAVHCEECGKRCAGGSALKSHSTKMHDGIPAKIKNGELEDAGKVEKPDGDDSWKDYDDPARADGGGDQ